MIMIIIIIIYIYMYVFEEVIGLQGLEGVKGFTGYLERGLRVGLEGFGLRFYLGPPEVVP